MKIFKYFISAVLMFAYTSVAVAQLDRSTPPEPGPAPEIQFTNPPSFTLENGLQVIVVENHELPVVSFQLTVDADPLMEGDAVGYVAATGDLLRNGTENMTKTEIDQAVDFIGANLSTYSNGIYASGLKKHAGTLQELMAEVLMKPVFPEEELEKYKKNQVSGLTAMRTNPSQISSRVGRKLRYGKHPYGEVMTEETVKNITREKVLDHYQTYYKPNISYLVMVGDIRLEEAKEMAQKYFGSWKRGDVPSHTWESPKNNDHRRVALVNKDDAVQSVIAITYPVDLKPGDPDAIAARLMNNILGGGVFSGYLMQNLREDKGYTYGARSQLSNDPLAGYFSAGAEVGTEVTDSAIHEFLYEMNRIRDEKVDEEHLNLAKNALYGSFARSLEDARTVAGFALNTRRYDLPADYYSDYLKKVEQVTAEDIQHVAQKYILPDQATILVVGNKKEVGQKISRFAMDQQVELYTSAGEPLEESAGIPKDMTAEKVIDRYIEALGGTEKLQAIREVTQKASVSFAGRTIHFEIYRKKPDKLTQRTLMNGTVVSEQVFDGEKATVTAMGQTQELSGKQLENMKHEALMHKFLRYDELGVELSLEGVENVDGTQAYEIKLTHPQGSVRYEYYDVESGLKIKSRQTDSTYPHERYGSF